MNKYEILLAELRQYEKLAVAWSGGVDSTLLLRAAIDALGAEKVIALHGYSELHPKKNIARLRKMVTEEFSLKLLFVELTLYPLSWAGFVENSHQRCYLCKKNMYTMFCSVAEKMGARVADGTNFDDLAKDRPGLQALDELAIPMPLVTAGLRKAEIRQYAEKRMLSNHSLASDSCLATRLLIDKRIELPLLQLVERAEEELAALGFLGHRCRLQTWGIELAVSQQQVTLYEENIGKIEQILKVIFQDYTPFSDYPAPELRAVIKEID